MEDKKINLTDRMLPAPINGGFKMEGYWVWCGSVVKGEDQRYHMFASRWKKPHPVQPSWLFSSEIVRAVSDTPEGPYHFAEVVFERRGPAYWDGMATHNPYICKVDDKYVLYYVGVTYPLKAEGEKEQYEPLSASHIVACGNQRIGVAVADSVFGPWKRFDEPRITTRSAYFDNFMVTNPAPIIKQNGEALVVYKSRAYKPGINNSVPFGGMEMGVAVANHYEDKHRTVSMTPLFDRGLYNLEDPFIWKEQSGEYKMIAKDMIGTACGEKRGGIIASSNDGFDWTLHEGSIAYSRYVKWDDGETRLMGNLDRPFILFEEGKATHIFFATSDGENGLRDCKNTWNMVIPLKPE